MNRVYRKNDCLTVAIEDMGTEGEGIGKVEGFTLFVKDAVPGDIVEAKIVKCKKNYAYARLEKVITPSPFRVEPKCAYHRQCGGCQLQTLSYDKQLDFKQRKIRNNLIRIGGFSAEYIDEKMEPIVGMEEPFHYRNKAQYPVGTDKSGNVVTGFYAGRTHNIIANTECSLGASENREILEVVLKHMRRYNIPAYDETTGKGLVRHVLIRKGFTSGEIMVCLVINKSFHGKPKEQETCNAADSDMYSGTEGFNPCVGKENLALSIKEKPTENFMEDNVTKADRKVSEKDGEFIFSDKIEFIPEQNVLLEELKAIKSMTSVSVSINTERTNVIMGKEIYTLWGSPVISDTIHVRNMQEEGYPFTGKELIFHISPLSFYQVNPVQTEKLYSLALEYAGLTGEETVWDLYCGIGTISLFLAGNAKKVYGVEVIPQAIEDARENAKRNGIRNAEFFVGKAEEILPEFYERKSYKEKDRSRDGGTKSRPEETAGKSNEWMMTDAGADMWDTGLKTLGAGLKISDSRMKMSDTRLKTLDAGTKMSDVESDADMRHPNVIVVDPPRKGCDEACLDTMLKMRPERIVYVSCDSATLARDLKVLCSGGYEIERVRGVDQFGMTVHCEVITLLQRVGGK